MKNNSIIFALLAAAALSINVSAQYTGWTYHDSLFIITTPEGANLPASVTETGFPLLVRLNKDFFTFSQAKADGADIRFSSTSGTALPFQIEEWDTTNGTATIWVRIPTITGNTRQPIMMHWGNSSATSESNGAAVFNSSNGYITVMHMGDPVNPFKDDVGTLTPVNAGTTPAAGPIGKCRRFAKGQGINGGDKVTAFPDSSYPSSTSVWFRAETPSSLVGWGRFAWCEQRPPCQFLVMQVTMPPSLKMADFFSNGGVTGHRPYTLGQWAHGEYVYQSGNSRIYLNGVLDTANLSSGVLSMPDTVGFQIGGFSDWGGYTMVGDLDEVRISRVARSSAWVKMEYESQRPAPTMVGPLVQAGTAFSVSQSSISVLEGKSVTVTATAGGAQQIYWVLKDTGIGTTVASDRMSFTFIAGRVTRDTTISLQVKAIYPTEVKTKDIAITIKEDQPDPVFSITAPQNWDGRSSIDVVSQITNLSDMQTKGVGTLTYSWDVTGVAAARIVTPGKLTLTRSQGSGKMTVSLTIFNGGTPVTRSAVITVTEPTTDAWVVRTPGANEKPVNNQFYARNDSNVCTVYFKGTLTTAPDSVYLKVYAGTTLSKRLAQKPVSGAYNFEPTLTPGLTEYKFEFGSKTGTTETIINTVTNVACGDAYIIDGQSNAEGFNYSDADPDSLYTSEWIRTWGDMGGNPGSGWHLAVSKYGSGQIGYWGLELARKLVTKYSMPICMINGAVGGTLVSAHVRNDTLPTDPQSIYGRLLTRVRGALLTHGIRGVFWHQGENNSGAGDPTGDWDYVHYQQYFVQMSSAWKQDYPNIKHYYLFQVYPYPCDMGPKDDELREAQRTLPSMFSNMSIMSTIGVTPAGRGTCHFSTPAYMQFVTTMIPFVERDNYGMVPSADITAPDIKKAYYTSAAKNEIALVFGQTMTWNSASTVNFYLDDVAGKVTSGSVSGKTIKLTLSGTSTAKMIKYVHGTDWNGDAANLLKGTNGIAALTFCNVPISPDSATVAVEALSTGKIAGGVSVVMKDRAMIISFGRLALASGPLTVELVNLRGQMVASRKIAQAGAAGESVTLPGLRHGVYVLKIKSIGRTELLRKITLF